MVNNFMMILIAHKFYCLSALFGSRQASQCYLVSSIPAFIKSKAVPWAEPLQSV